MATPSAPSPQIGADVPVGTAPAQPGGQSDGQPRNDPPAATMTQPAAAPAKKGKGSMPAPGFSFR
jgi:hypothetical protein